MGGDWNFPTVSALSHKLTDFRESYLGLFYQFLIRSFTRFFFRCICDIYIIFIDDKKGADFVGHILSLRSTVNGNSKLNIPRPNLWSYFVFMLASKW